jgi:hypothetical protein
MSSGGIRALFDEARRVGDVVREETSTDPGSPEGIEARGRQLFLLRNAGADLQAAEAEFVDATLELLDGEIGVLQRYRSCRPRMSRW